MADVRPEISKVTQCTFLAGAGLVAIAVCLAIAYFFNQAPKAGISGVAALVFGLTLLYLSVDRAEHELEST